MEKVEERWAIQPGAAQWLPEEQDSVEPRIGQVSKQ
jgi:hypothetical protein